MSQHVTKNNVELIRQNALLRLEKIIPVVDSEESFFIYEAIMNYHPHSIIYNYAINVLHDLLYTNSEDIITDVAEKMNELKIRLNIKNLKLTIEEIYNILKMIFGLTDNEIKSKSRKGEYVLFRKIFSFFCVKKEDYGLVVVGGYINRDHATVRHEIKTFIDNLSTSPKEVRLLFKCWKIIYPSEQIPSIETIVILYGY